MRPSKHASLITAAAVGVVAIIWTVVSVQRDMDERFASARRENHLIYSNVSQLMHGPSIDFATLEDEAVESPLGRLEAKLVSAEVFLSDGTILFPAAEDAESGEAEKQVPPKEALRGARISTFIEPQDGDATPTEASKNFLTLIQSGDLRGEEWGPLKAQDGRTIGAIRVVTDVSDMRGDVLFTTSLNAGFVIVAMLIAGLSAGYAASAAADGAVFGSKPARAEGRRIGSLPWSRREGGVATEDEDAAPLVATDPLTGLLTHKEAHAALDREVGIARKERRPLSVVMADIDDFRAMNSGYGADIGDELLKMVGEAIRWLSQSHGGITCRFGSDEFVAILPGKDEIGATEFVRGVDARLRTLKFPAETRYPVTIRVSAGSATLSGDVETAQELLAFAETAMRESRGRHDREFEAELRPAVGDTIRRGPHVDAPPQDDPGSRDDREIRIESVPLARPAADVESLPPAGEPPPEYPSASTRSTERPPSDEPGLDTSDDDSVEGNVESSVLEELRRSADHPPRPSRLDW